MEWGWKRMEQKWRKELLSHAKGRVLELSVGEGVNFRHYPSSVNATATDMSSRMIQKAIKEAALHGVNAEFIVSRTEELDFKPNSFDCIISIFSLCAYGNPLQVLNQFNTWCKPDGVILIMEHGLSRYWLGRWLQKMWEPYHYRRTGCHLDMDIKSIIERSSPRIRQAKRKMGGVIYLVWASPSKIVPGII